MINIAHDSVCFGCGVCAVSCAKKAIEITLSEDGFWIPKINHDRCVECGICNKVCSYSDNIISSSDDRTETAKAYAVVNKDGDILSASTSGGAGFAIATYLHQKGYTLVGVRYNTEKGIAEHFVTNQLDEFKQTMNSKYIPSYTVDGFDSLMDGRKYAIFGTPCQIDSLRRWVQLRKKEPNFIFIDLFCHGVPSYLLWTAYINHHIGENENLLRPVFRDKCNGWHAYTMSLLTDKRRISTTQQHNDLFQNIFLGDFSLNTPCYTCKFRATKSAADIRIGDLWGGKYANNDSGVTGVLTFTNKGETVIGNLLEYCHITNETVPVILAGQLLSDLPVPKQRKKLLKSIRRGKSLPKLYFIYCHRMWIKNLVPYKVKCLLKKIIYKLKR